MRKEKIKLMITGEIFLEKYNNDFYNSQFQKRTNRKKDDLF